MLRKLYLPKYSTNLSVSLRMELYFFELDMHERRKETIKGAIRELLEKIRKYSDTMKK
eukprot:m.9003 g.9003  ORF g.9003 m.9003 type:complete len:58 (+) comp3993_c0_seq1:1331-1504(+)